MTQKGNPLTLTTEPGPNLTVKTDSPQSAQCALFDAKRQLMNYCVFCQSREKHKPSTFTYRYGQNHATLPDVSPGVARMQIAFLFLKKCTGKPEAAPHLFLKRR